MSLLARFSATAGPAAVLAAILAAVPAGGPWLSAGTAGAVRYELQEGSTILDECLFCDRAPILRPIRGSFLLAPDPTVPAGGPTHILTELTFQDLGGEYGGFGSGRYTLSFDEVPPHQAMELDVEVNGVEGIRLERGSIAVHAAWPAIDITLGEPEPHDEFHVYTLHLAAAPPADLVLYELQEGSELVQDCREPCRPPAILIPLKGTFLLGEIAGPPNPVSTYRVDAVDFSGDAGGTEWRLRGAGTYRHGGEVALNQDMALAMTVNGGPLIHLTALPGPVGAEFPAIDIRLEEEDGPIFPYYTARVVARPAAGQPEPRYRRGDPSGDGRLDLADPESLLAFLFRRGAVPGCLDAADANDDEALDLGDVLYLLFHLFAGGPPPPAPGPERCGIAATPSLGCGAYPACP
jgi:hypothetical protein